jgi:hypothetical protein
VKDRDKTHRIIGVILIMWYQSSKLITVQSEVVVVELVVVLLDGIITSRDGFTSWRVLL